MIVILEPDSDKTSANYNELITHLTNLPNIEVRVHDVHGVQQTLTEIYMIGETAQIPLESIQTLPGVDRVIRVSEEYRILGRHKDDLRSTSFTYNGVTFSQDNLNVFAGLCAVDTPEHVEMMMKALPKFCSGEFFV